MTKSDRSIAGLTGVRCPGCVEYYKCGTVEFTAVTTLEVHLQGVHGWTKTEVNCWLDTYCTPGRAHKGPDWYETEREPRPSEPTTDGIHRPTVCGKCHRRLESEGCRTCATRPRLTGEHEGDVRRWIETLVYEPKRRFARAYVAAYRSNAALPSGAAYGLSPKASDHVTDRLRYMGVR